MTARRCALLALVAAALAVLPGAAQARPPLRKAIWGPTTFNGRSQFPIYRDLGVDIYQSTLAWSSIAPTRPANPRDPNDPAYRWPAEADYAVSQARRYGIGVGFMLITTPAWANGGRAANYVPDSAADFADFAQAAARRYGSVHRWLIWGEPIRRANFEPLVAEGNLADRTGPLTPDQALAPRLYAQLLDAAYGSLKAVSAKNLVIGGNTTTYGNINPYNWIRYMKLPDGRAPRMDLYGHNPFGTREPDLRDSQILPSVIDFGDLDVLARWLDRYQRRGSRQRHLKIFISEYTAPTDVDSYEFNFHVTRPLQARWLSAAFRVSRSFSRIETLGWIGLRDIRRADGKETRTGLIDGRGRRKPAYYVYKRSG